VIDRLPQAIIVSSEHAARLLTQQFACDQKRIHVVPDAVDTDLFQPGGSREETLDLKRLLGIPRASKVVVYLGLLAEYQGISMLLQAARELAESQQDLHFLIMGHPNVQHYTHLAAGMGLSEKVTFTGRVPYAEAQRYLGLGDVAVAPKLSATEGSGKLPNYMAMGLPTVAFDTPVSREYLGEWGVYARAGDHLSLAQAIASLLEDSQRAATLAGALRERAVEQYSWSALVQRLGHIYAELLGEKGNL
ncbi:MAG: glycosyltransferase family 4 protein, partial [Anaerolineae bacterium]|nr:glycosyltransferase family 4 protein [Anaerolineae bacterium]